jgi:hypothetical protein
MTGLAQSVGTMLRLTLAVGFLAAAAFLFYAAINGVHLRLGRQFMGPTQALWPAVFCLAFGIGLLPRFQALAGVGSEPAAPSRAKAKPSRKASAKKAASKHGARGSNSGA